MLGNFDLGSAKKGPDGKIQVDEETKSKLIDA